MGFIYSSSTDSLCLVPAKHTNFSKSTTTVVIIYLSKSESSDQEKKYSNCCFTSLQLTTNQKLTYI